MRRPRAACLRETASARRFNIIRAHRVVFELLPNSFFVILTRVISSKSPCNPISFYRLLLTLILYPLDLSWFCRWNVELEIVVRWPLGYFGWIYVSRLVSVWPRQHLYLLSARNILECRNRKRKWALERWKRNRSWPLGVEFFDLACSLFV